MEFSNKKELMLSTVLIATGVILAFLGKSLSQTIASFKVTDMVSDVLNWFISLMASFLAAITNRPYEVFEPNFNVFLDILLPGLLGIIAAACLIIAGLILFNDFDSKEKVESAIRITLITTLTVLSLFVLYNSLKLILITLLLIAAIAICIYFLFSFFSMLFGKEK